MQDPFVLDAAEYGVPQHRRRLFLSGSLKDRGFKLPVRSRQPIGMECCKRGSSAPTGGPKSCRKGRLGNSDQGQAYYIDIIT